MGIAGITGDPAYPPKSARQVPPLPLGKLGHTIVKGFETLGWHWWPSDTAILTRPYDGRNACNNCGPCDIGCSQGAKASVDITYWPKALAQGAGLTTQARVREITVRPDGLADGVLYYDAAGHIQEQKAHLVVLACNGIGTPRLLLNSRSGLFPDGLANSSGLVGRNLMFHPYAMVTGIFPERLEGYKGPNGCSIFSQEFYETDLSRGFVRGYSFQVVRGFGPVGTALGGAVRQRVPWGAVHRRGFDERFDRMITLAVTGEDLPEPHNRVVLDPQLSDSDGIPAPQVMYTLSENSRKLLALWYRPRYRSAAGRRGGGGAGQPAVALSRLASHGDGAHGRAPCQLRGGCVWQMPRCPEPVYHRRQYSGHGRSGQPHVDDPSPGTIHR